MSSQAHYHKIDGSSILCEIVAELGGGMAQLHSLEAANPLETICPLLEPGSDPQPYHAVRSEPEAP